MKLGRVIHIAITFILTTASVTTFAQKIGDFALVDNFGSFQNMSWYNDNDAIVLVSYSPYSEYFPKVAEFVNELSKLNNSKRFMTFLINPGVSQDRIEITNHLESLNLDIPVLMDDTQLVSDALGITNIAQVMILDTRNFELIYKGEINNEFKSSLSDIVSQGDLPNLTNEYGLGEKVDFTNLKQYVGRELSYLDDIAPIIAEKCAKCHREGSIAPFALDSHLAVRGWSPMIREVVLTRRMPPGQIDNKVGRKIRNEMNLSDEEMIKLVKWIEMGSRNESENDPLADLTWPETKWSLGEPDLIVEIDPQTIPATGVLDILDYPIELNLEKDVWIRGSEIAPGDPRVVHHVITTVVPKDGMLSLVERVKLVLDQVEPEKANAALEIIRSAEEAGVEPDRATLLKSLGTGIDTSLILVGSANPNLALIAGYAAGVNAEMNPEGVGGVIPKDHNLNLQIHYTTMGQEVVDRTQVGLWFYDEGDIPQIRRTNVVSSSRFMEIPPYSKHYEMEASVTVREDAFLRAIMPHMHYRGKEVEFTVIYPNGKRELVLSVPDYSFNWQINHFLEEPLFMPKGTELVVSGAYDNSEQNPFNPDPSAHVTFGRQSWDEMFAGIYEWQYAH